MEVLGTACPFFQYNEIIKANDGCIDAFDYFEMHPPLISFLKGNGFFDEKINFRDNVIRAPKRKYRQPFFANPLIPLRGIGKPLNINGGRPYALSAKSIGG